jgi:hypothetical protein
MDMKFWPMCLLLLMLSGCTTAIIMDDGGQHVVVEVRGRGDGVWQDAKQKADGRCAQYGKVAANPMIDAPAWWAMTPGHVQYDCVKPPG